MLTSILKILIFVSANIIKLNLRKPLYYIFFYIALLFIWRYLYLTYQNSFQYYYDIFRSALNEHAIPPFYLIQESWNIRALLPITVGLGLILVIWWLLHKTTTIKLFQAYFIGIASLIFSLSLAWSEQENRILGVTAHYETYANDLKSFSNSHELFNHYTDLQTTLDVHGQHYPPGIHWLMKILQEINFWEGIKILEFLCFLLIFGILFQLLKTIRTDNKQILYALLLLAIAPGFVIYNTLDVTSITVCLFLLLIYYTIQTVNHLQSVLYPTLLGIFLFLYSMVSFTVFIALMMMVIYIILLVYHKQINISTLIKPASISLITLIILHGLLYQFSNFNILLCFKQSVTNNQLLNHSSGFDDISRYMIRSSGNMLAFAISVGLMFFYTFQNLSNLLYKSVWICITISAFSGLFFGETERIWVFFIPLLVPIAAESICKYSIRKSQVLFLLFIVFTIVQEVFFKHYM